MSQSTNLVLFSQSDIVIQDAIDFCVNRLGILRFFFAKKTIENERIDYPETNAELQALVDFSKDANTLFVDFLYDIILDPLRDYFDLIPESIKGQINADNFSAYFGPHTCEGMNHEGDDISIQMNFSLCIWSYGIPPDSEATFAKLSSSNYIQELIARLSSFVQPISFAMILDT